MKTKSIVVSCIFIQSLKFYNMEKRLLVILLALAFSVPGWAQQQVSGKVTSSEDGTALPGVNVLVSGTQQGTITDFDGNYKITVPEDGSLQFSML
jgi:hypothetical protein